MTLNIGAFVASALATAKRLGVAGTVTITRSIPEDFVPSTDQALNPAATSFTATAVCETPDGDEPRTGGTDPQQSRRWTIAANDCAFPPESGHTLTIGDKESRILSSTPVSPAGVALAYTVEVAG